MSIISSPPYYDRYEQYKSEKKNYTQVLAVPGRVAQSREFNEMQSTLKDIIKSLGDSIMKDGNIIEGCQVIPDKVANTVRVTEGKVYMKGMVLPLEDTIIDSNITGNSPTVGNKIVGVVLNERPVYASEDPSLRDPAAGFDNYNQPGCDRLESTLQVVVVDSSSANESIAVLATLVDGEIYSGQKAQDYSVLNETLARRTYDESGSYIVEGLNVRVEPSISGNPEKFTVVVESGKAYVHGYELSIPSARKIELDRSTKTIPVTASHTHSTGSIYTLTTGGPYVEKILEVEGSMKVEDESINIINSGAVSLSNSKVHEIEKITTPDGKLISSNRYVLEQGATTSNIYWRDTDYPGEVLVTYYHRYIFTQDIDYKLDINESNSHTLTWLSGGKEPESGKPLLITFNKYSARKDNVYINGRGDIAIIEGIPAEYGTEVLPSAPSYTLSLAYIMSPPGGVVDNTKDYQNITVSNIGLTRFTMSDIQSILNRVRTLEYDQTILSLNNEAKEYATDNKRGIFTDPFIDLSKLGMYFNLSPEGAVLDAEKPHYNSAIDLDSNMMYLPLVSSYQDILHDSNRSNTHTYESVATLGTKPGEQRIVLSQNKATKSFLIAPYVSYPQTPEVFITPSIDTWYEDTIIELYESINRSKVISTSSKTVNVTKYDPDWTGSKLYYTNTKTTTKYTAVGTQVETLIDEDIVSQSMVAYLRSRTITVSGYNYQPGAKNITCYFDGYRIAMTPVTSTGTTGNADGSVNANDQGSFKAKFVIPKKTIYTGTRLVTFRGSNIDSHSNEASTFYQGIGIARTIKRTITTITTVLKHRADTTTITKTYYDPLAQTFVLDNMTLLSGVNVYFENVPADPVPVTCEIREVQDGNIRSTVYGFKTMTADEIRNNTSLDGSKPTTFRFNDPVLIEANKEYAIVLRSTSTAYRVFVAEIGEYAIGRDGNPTTEMVMSNPYLQGVMMSSSNNSSWTIHQKTDMKFDLIADEYVNNSEIYFEELVSEEGFCKLNLSAEALVFDGTEILWECSIDGGPFNAISPYNPRVLNTLAYRAILRATLSRNSGNLTPIIALDSISFNTSKYDVSEDSYYSSNQILGLDEYDTVEIILDTYEPASTELQVFISDSNNNATPYKLTQAQFVSSKELTHGWWEKTYRAKLDVKATQCRLFVKFIGTEYRSPAMRRLRAIMS